MMDLQVLEGKLLEILFESDHRQELKVLVGNRIEKAISYPQLIGKCSPGDQLILNTTAVSLSLGTGGYHFVMGIIGKNYNGLSKGKGHIMKMRYTPNQGRVLSVEEPESPYHHLFSQKDTIAGLPVIVGSLHSMLSPVCLGFNHEAPNKRLVYIMSDGAALPLYLSRQVESLTKCGLLTDTITFNNAFGGDYEAVNVYSALLTAKYVCYADAAIILMGPGIVGTNSRWGTTALEQGIYLNAVHILHGCAIGLLRISFAEHRKRHQGISHHCLTALTRITEHACYIPVPSELQTNQTIAAQLQLLQAHMLKWIDTDNYLHLFEATNLNLNSMGRSFTDDPWFFAAALAAGVFAARQIDATGQD